MLPDVALSVNPVGSVPDAIDHVYGPTPPCAPSVAAYADPTPPEGSDGVVIANCAAACCTGGAIMSDDGGGALGHPLNISTMQIINAGQDSERATWPFIMRGEKK